MRSRQICCRALIFPVPIFLITLVVFGGVLWGSSAHWQVIVEAAQNRSTDTTAAHKVALGDPDGYVGSSACSNCHLNIYKDFSRTKMGRSMSRVTPELIKTLSVPAKLYSQSLDRHFEVFSQNGKLFQSEYQTDADGKGIFRDTHEIEWIMGGGANGFGALTRRGEYLFEAPLSYYSQLGRWDLSPGYESLDLGFNRPIRGPCISCHSGRPRLQNQTTGKFDAVAFPQLSIGCENCHGPGRSHISAMLTPRSAHSGTQIVNPSRLSASLGNDICISCHEGGDSRVLRDGKTYQDFRPGTPLDDTLTILTIARMPGDRDDGDHIQHYDEMSMSQCFQKSAGQLRCATCHDPHVEPTRQEAPAYFNAKCMGCHADRTCTLAESSRKKTTPPDNCIECHMPRRDLQKIAHTSLTNHRILARPGEPWPETPPEETIKSLPGLIHVDRVPGRGNDLPLLTQLDALRQLSTLRPEYLEAYQSVLDESASALPSDASVQLQLGHRNLDDGDLEKASEHLRRSLALDPRQAMAYNYLSRTLAQTGQMGDAIAASEKAVEQDPYNPIVHKTLIDQLLQAKEYQKAQAAMERYLRDFPEDSFMRQRLALARQ